MNKVIKTLITICLAVILSLAFTANSFAVSTIFLDADTPTTGSLLDLQPLVTSHGDITFVGELFPGTYDDEAFAAGATWNAFNIQDSTPGNQWARLDFSFDVISVEFIYGGNMGNIYIEARNEEGGVVDSFYQDDTGPLQPAGPIMLSGLGIRSLYWEESSEQCGYAFLDNITVTIPGQCENHNVWGWAWSDNIGWISFSCRDTMAEGTGTDYGVDVDTDTGELSGYAWSDNIGWITFNQSDLTGCPAGTCEAEVSLSTGEVSGWARAYRAIAPLGQSLGGWDGWIGLNGTWTDGVSLNSAPIPSEFEGWAWGSDVVGWISFNDKNLNGSPGLVDYQVMTNIIINDSPYVEPGSTDIQYEEYCDFSPTGRVGFKWTYQDNDGDQQAQYNLQIATDAGFNILVVDTIVNQPAISPGDNGTSAVSIKQDLDDPLDIAYGDTYFWRVKVKDAAGRWSTNWESGPSFSTPSNPYPNPSFDWYPESPPAEVEVAFTDNSTCYTGFDNCKDDAGTSYEWDFNNDSIIDDTTKGDTIYTYTATGNYTAKLGVTDIIGGIPRTCYQEESLTATLPLPTWKEIAPF